MSLLPKAKNTDLKDRVIYNTFVGAAFGILTLAIGFFSLPALVAFLGIEGYGLLSYSRLFSGNGILVLFDFGLSAAIVKYVAEFYSNEKKSNISQLISASFWLLGSCGLLLGVIGWWQADNISIALVGSGANESNLAWIIGWSFAVWPLELSGMAIYAAIQGFQYYSFLRAIECTWFVLYMAIGICLAMVGYGFERVAFVGLLLSLVKLLAAGLFLINKHPEIQLNLLNRPTLSALSMPMRMGRHLFISQLFSTIVNQGEKLVVAALLPVSMMTFYEVLIKLPRMIKSFFSFGAAAIVPAASELGARECLDGNRRLLQLGLQFNLVITVPAVCACIFLAEPFLNIWMGSSFIVLAHLLQVLLIFNILNPLSSFSWQIMIGMNRKVHHTPMIQWINLVATVLAWFVLIPRFGLWGIVASFFTILLTIPWSIVVPCRELGCSPALLVERFFRILLCSLLPWALFFTIVPLSKMNSYFSLFALGLLWVTISWILCYFFGVNDDMRFVIKRQMYRIRSIFIRAVK